MTFLFLTYSNLCYDSPSAPQIWVKWTPDFCCAAWSWAQRAAWWCTHTCCWRSGSGTPTSLPRTPCRSPRTPTLPLSSSSVILANVQSNSSHSYTFCYPGGCVEFVTKNVTLGYIVKHRFDPPLHQQSLTLRLYCALRKYAPREEFFLLVGSERPIRSTLIFFVLWVRPLPSEPSAAVWASGHTLGMNAFVFLFQNYQKMQGKTKQKQRRNKRR